ncbi:uncharacterized protein LOC135946374 [Cloeon dipterum]|uniref:uncharacterized protein LOC135946374 n=1 Tax=Cloeon dipterum TaxID=197152 RepID=UPI00322089D1
MTYTTMIFGKKKVTWAENMKLCCSIGMKPIRVTDELLSTLNSIGVSYESFKIFDKTVNSTEDRMLIKTSFWTAATRQGCAGHYRFCMHDDVGPWDSQDSFWDTVNPRDSGSCLVVDRQYANKEGAPFGVRQVQCSVPIANFACQKDGKRITDFVNLEKNADMEKANTGCDLPYCAEQQLCMPSTVTPSKYENGERVLLSTFTS